MYVNYSGWTKEHGSFYCNIFIDENKQDYELKYADGTISKQVSPFQCVTADWNHDGDVYTQFGAWFHHPKYNSSDFWTPEAMVRAVADGLDKDRRFNSNEVIAVSGVEVPLPGRRPILDDAIRRSEQRALHQDIERNRKMKAVCIRSPDEPWVR